MVRKYFDLDKNYLLEKSQLQQEELLIRLMVDEVINYYHKFCNPLGLEDDIIRALKTYTFDEPEVFTEFYKDLSGIYRYLNSDNQLEFLFEGGDHLTKYSREWGNTFCSWIADFCNHKTFINAVFSQTVLKSNSGFTLKTNRLKYFTENYFKVKLYKYRGIQNVA